MDSATQYTLFISNGHGEHVCGAATAARLRQIAPHRIAGIDRDKPITFLLL